MTPAFLFARLRRLSLETGYGIEQSRRLIERQADFSTTRDFERAEATKTVLEGISEDRILVLSDPLAIASPNCFDALSAALQAHPEAVAAVPRTNQTTNDAQRMGVPASFLTLGQFERRFHELDPHVHLTEWTDADPGLYLAKTDSLRDDANPLPHALRNRTVAIVDETFLYRYAPQQRMPRLDLLELIPTNAASVLEIGCGEGILGEQIRNRQQARVVGIELSYHAAEAARARLDEVHARDVRDAVRDIDERFEWIVGGDILEHLTDPWEFLRELKRVVEPGGHLLLSIPNIACWPVVAELLRGRFDYIYAGHLSAGHLRFFTRRTIEDTMWMAGWEITSILPQPDFAPDEREELFSKLDRGGIAYSREDLETPGWYVIARAAHSS
jgi:2-polyprenyl-3-methyl-5-hydroxy-6-metoxy-1,4-benzoquinol methylase